MITEIEFDAAVKTIEAYHRQIMTVVSSVKSIQKKGIKHLEDIERGDFVTCEFVHSASRKHLTKGKSYEVINVIRDFSFTIVTDSGVRKDYRVTNNHFKIH